MPFIKVTCGPVESAEKKAEIISRMTDTLQEVLNVPRQAITVHIEELSTDNMGVGGTTISEVRRRREQEANK